MPKATDIVGTIRVPESDYGRFWNFMKSMPSSEFTPTLHAEAPTTKRKNGKDTEGTSGRCIVLGGLMSNSSMSTQEITAAIVAHGKSPKSVGNLLHELKVKQKMIKPQGKGYAITAAGRKFYNTSCPVK